MYLTLTFLRNMSDEVGTTESLHTRISREREERKLALKIKNFANDSKSNSGHLVNPKRYESAIQRTQKELSPVVIPNLVRNVAPPAQTIGDPVEFYCWKDGKVGTIKLYGEKFKAF